MNDDQLGLDSFCGTARLFPLPNLVLFPHVVQPLHIFEPRYRQMTADALNGDRLIAIVLLEQGWESDYEGRPAAHTVGCLSRVVADQLLPDGRYNLLVRGLSRVRLVEEPPCNKLYRSAHARLVSDEPPEVLAEATRLRTALSERVLPRFAASSARDQLAELFRGEMTLGALCDILSFALPLPVEQKQSLLEEVVVIRRAEHLLELLATLKPVASPDRTFPPDFSSN